MVLKPVIWEVKYSLVIMKMETDTAEQAISNVRYTLEKLFQDTG